MIAGTLVLEDVKLHFHLNNEDHQIHLDLQDSLSGESCHVTMPAAIFAEALGHALHPDGCNGDITDQCEKAMASIPASCKFVP